MILINYDQKKATSSKLLIDLQDINSTSPDISTFFTNQSPAKCQYLGVNNNPEKQIKIIQFDQPKIEKTNMDGK